MSKLSPARFDANDQTYKANISKQYRTLAWVKRIAFIYICSIAMNNINVLTKAINKFVFRQLFLYCIKFVGRTYLLYIYMGRNRTLFIKFEK